MKLKQAGNVLFKFVRDIVIIVVVGAVLSVIPGIGRTMPFVIPVAFVIRWFMWAFQTYQVFKAPSIPHFYEGGPYEPFPSLVIPEGLTDDQARALMLEYKADKETYESAVRDEQTAAQGARSSDLRNKVMRAASIGARIGRMTRHHGDK